MARLQLEAERLQQRRKILAGNAYYANTAASGSSGDRCNGGGV